LRSWSRQNSARSGQSSAVATGLAGCISRSSGLAGPPGCGGNGAVAKASGTASVRGAFFDSVADRVTDSLVLGGVIGGIIAYVGFNGYQTATMNFQTFSQVAFAFAVIVLILLFRPAGLFGRVRQLRV